MARDERHELHGLLRERLAPIICAVFAAVLTMGLLVGWQYLSMPPEPKKEVVQQEEVEQPQGDPRVEELLQELTLEQRVAQLFVVHPESITGVECVQAAGETTMAAISEHPVGGLIYSSDNLVSPEQVQTMLRSTQNFSKDACGLPMLICVDEEGGTVARVASNPAFAVEDPGSACAIGETGDVEQARSAASRCARYLRDLGFNVDFAPVADVATSTESALYWRSFGSDPALVGQMVAAQVEAFGREGILCCAKHFPGIGGPAQDSHEGSITSMRTEEEMSSFELVPFRDAIEAGVPMVMVGHLTCLGLGEGQGLPASLDSRVIQGLLRGKLGFSGLIITDALEMGAVSEEVCPAWEQGVRAIEAGCDLVLCPTDFDASYQALLQAVRQGRIPQERIDESCRRIIATKLNILA